MIKSYKSLDHGVHFVSPVTGMMLFFVVIPYLDDTDLLLRADNPETPEIVFFSENPTYTFNLGSTYAGNWRRPQSQKVSRKCW